MRAPPNSERGSAPAETGALAKELPDHAKRHSTSHLLAEVAPRLEAIATNAAAAMLGDLDLLSPADLRTIASLLEDARRERADALREHADTDVRALLELEAMGELAPSLVRHILITDYKRLIPNVYWGTPDASGAA